ncbi:MAG: type 1 glutamine amidotransferase, partial [Alphaproteobacteria bacterium]|nr:type 1 glutamine amidotransferase [Alphaproteobacteria bacterium]
DFLLVMGGAMDVWETEAHPWLVREKAAIREWTMNRDRPYFGVCLGLRLVAEALGGAVGLARGPEVGIGKVTLTPLGRRHEMAAGLRPSMKVMQWHHAEVTRLPDGAEVLASSDISPVQIMAAGPNILATQFHGELTPELVDRWADLPQYRQWLDEALGANAYERVRAEALPLMPRMARMSQQMFDNLVNGRQAIAAAA